MFSAASDPSKYAVGEIMMLAHVGGEALTLVSSWALDSHAGSADGTSTWRARDLQIFLNLKLIMSSVTWCDVGGGLVRILLPFEFKAMHPERDDGPAMILVS